MKKVAIIAGELSADILGSEILEESTKGKRSFKFLEGPVFSQFLLADEINRTSPRIQSALLECMNERQVSRKEWHRDLSLLVMAFLCVKA